MLCPSDVLAALDVGLSVTSATLGDGVVTTEGLLTGGLISKAGSSTVLGADEHRWKSDEKLRQSAGFSHPGEWDDVVLALRQARPDDDVEVAVRTR